MYTLPTLNNADRGTAVTSLSLNPDPLGIHPQILFLLMNCLATLLTYPEQGPQGTSFTLQTDLPHPDLALWSFEPMCRTLHLSSLHIVEACVVMGSLLDEQQPHLLHISNTKTCHKKSRAWFQPVGMGRKERKWRKEESWQEGL